MTQEEKRLLEIELATRSQYGVICAIKPVAPFHDLEFGGKQKIKNICIRENDSIFTFGPYEVHGVENIKPYLRPLSSMTEEEKEYIKNRWCYEDWGDIYNFLNHYQIDAGDAYSFTDWLNEHHFDYRGLIEKGLALEAPVDMYRND